MSHYQLLYYGRKSSQSGQRLSTTALAVVSRRAEVIALAALRSLKLTGWQGMEGGDKDSTSRGQHSQVHYRLWLWGDASTSKGQHSLVDEVRI